MKEADIRPAELFDRYLAVVREDIRRLFANKSGFVEVHCPACASASADLAFGKLGFEYRTCRSCRSLYLSPRPSAEAIDRYYQEGDAVRFWSTNFYRETADARRQRIYRPRAELLRRLADQGVLAHRRVFADIGAGYGLFLQEVARLGLFETITGVEPAPNMVASCRDKGFAVLAEPVEAVAGDQLKADCATSFEVIEHVFSPYDFLLAAGRVLAPGGVLLFTTLTISGFDLQVLWERSKSIYPPHHINFLTVEGYRLLLDRAGYDVVEMTTPGQLDVDIVANALAEDPMLELPRFVRYLLDARDEGARESLQAFLQKHQLSSHMSCVARKRASEGRD